jgi:hypothetical protein
MRPIISVAAGLDLDGPHDLRHNYPAWLVEAASLGGCRGADGHVAGRCGERDVSLIGGRYPYMTAEMQVRVATVIEQQLSPALAYVPQVRWDRWETP